MFLSFLLVGVSGVVASPVPSSSGQVVCVKRDACTCDMSDGSGSVSLHSLARPEAPYELDSNSYRFMYSPCTAMKHAKGECEQDTSVCLEGREEDFGYNFGRASDPEFITDKNGNVTVQYTSEVGNKTRTAKVQLVCDPSVTERPLSMFKGMTETAMNWTFTTVCACPGACESPAITCDLVDSCSCAVNGDLGVIDLRNMLIPLSGPNGNNVMFWNLCSGLLMEKDVKYEVKVICDHTAHAPRLNAVKTQTGFKLSLVSRCACVIQNRSKVKMAAKMTTYLGFHSGY
ncbi:uncharacterized protein LOC118411724 [Branchiostoma floridae]|uniref:Uncharacterized protein LOC118411724 n=1 Tax=Branchiostoma floridae TaxID=7739 RepID=A0A9J7MK63_BRAFL|nr:uncharacterized protein LOC118411724 [Branchiostoma floridae]